MKFRLDKFSLAYIIFFISVIFYGNTYIISGITPRHFMSVIMMLFCFKLKALRIDIYWKVYIIYILFFFISAIFDDNISYFIHYLLGYFGVSYIAYISTEQYVKKNCNIEILLNVLLIFACINSITTISQIFYPDLAKTITSIMGTASPDSFDYYLTYHADDGAFSFSMTGLFENAVENGYWSMFFLLLPVYKLKRNQDSSSSILFWLFVYFIMLLGLFACQQRAPMVIASLFSLYYLLRDSQKFKIYFVIALSLFLLYGYSKIDWDSLGRLSSITELGVREDIYKTCRTFIADNWLLGGIKTYNSYYDFWPHNFFYNAIIYSGIFGFTTIVFLLLKQVIVAAAYSLRENSNSLVTLFSLAYLGVTINSIFHNLSLVLGSPMFWLLWGLFWFNRNELHNVANNSKTQILTCAKHYEPTLTTAEGQNAK